MDLSGFLLSLPAEFFALPYEKVLRSGRNEVRLFTVDGQRVVVKSFCRISALNRVVYGTFRQSKAMRAYFNALKLTQLGFGTPEPIAAIDVRRHGLLRQSFYVYAYSDYGDMKELLEHYPDKRLEPLLDSLAAFIHRMYETGVLHHDFNVMNLLYRRCEGGEYDFQLIDINRMDFRRRLSARQRLSNLRRFNCKPAAYLYLLERYAEMTKMDCEMTQLRGMGFRLLDTLWHEMKQRIKTLL